MRPFDLTGELPTGTTLLEASAGTGKTYAIAALATRYVAQGHATIDQLLMVTFGRAATRELRERVREALTRSRDALRRPGAVRPGASDPVLDLLLSQPPEERARAAERLAAAVAGFDAATIATTHQFCLHALSGLGVAAEPPEPAQVIYLLPESGALCRYVRDRDPGTPPPIPLRDQDGTDAT